MDTQAAAGDPSMDDILASIRRILNEDEAPASPGEAPAPDDDVLVLDHTMLIEEPAPMSDSPSPVGASPAPQPPPSQADAACSARPEARGAPRREAAPPAPPASGETLLAPSTEAAATASMGALVRVLGQQQTEVYRGGPTLEDMVREEMRPMVKAWLDEHLPAMVERLVRAEIARVTGAVA